MEEIWEPLEKRSSSDGGPSDGFGVSQRGTTSYRCRIFLDIIEYGLLVLEGHTIFRGLRVLWVLLGGPLGPKRRLVVSVDGKLKFKKKRPARKMNLVANLTPPEFTQKFEGVLAMRGLGKGDPELDSDLVREAAKEWRTVEPAVTVACTVRSLVPLGRRRRRRLYLGSRSRRPAS